MNYESNLIKLTRRREGASGREEQQHNGNDDKKAKQEESLPHKFHLQTHFIHVSYQKIK